MKYEIEKPTRFTTALKNMTNGDVFQFTCENGLNMFTDSLYMMTNNSRRIVSLRSGYCGEVIITDEMREWPVAEFECLGFKERRHVKFVDLGNKSETDLDDINFEDEPKPKKLTDEESLHAYLTGMLSEFRKMKGNGVYRYACVDKDGRIHACTAKPVIDAYQWRQGASGKFKYTFIGTCTQPGYGNAWNKVLVKADK
jgi:hypothetical protein